MGKVCNWGGPKVLVSTLVMLNEVKYLVLSVLWLEILRDAQNDRRNVVIQHDCKDFSDQPRHNQNL